MLEIPSYVIGVTISGEPIVCYHFPREVGFAEHYGMRVRKFNHKKH